MKFVIVSAVLLCGISATSGFLFQPWNQLQTYQNWNPVQSFSAARAQPQPQPMQLIPVQYYYPQPHPQEPTVIVITRSKPETDQSSNNISINTNSSSSSVANANNENSIQNLAPQPTVSAAPASPVLQSVVVISNPSNPHAATPSTDTPPSTRIIDDAVVTSAEIVTTTSTQAPTTTPAEIATTIASTSALPNQDELAQSTLPQASGTPNIPITLQSLVVVGGQQQTPPVPASPTVIAIKDEPSNMDPTQSASTLIPTTRKEIVI